VRLVPYVETLWFYESAHTHGREVVLPSARSQLLVNLETPGAVLRGASTKATAVDPAGMRRMIGVLFRPGGAFALSSVPGLHLQNAGVALDDLGLREDDPLADRLSRAVDAGEALTALERWLVARMPTPTAATAELGMVTAATRWLAAGLPVGDVVDRMGTSRSRFVRLFGAHVGTTAKQYASVTRFQRVVRALAAGEDDLAQLALRCGYFDQAHLCHDFRKLSGRTPTAYRPRDAREPNHIVD